MKEKAKYYLKRISIIIAGILLLVSIKVTINLFSPGYSSTNSNNRVLIDAYEFQETQTKYKELEKMFAEDRERMIQMGINPDSINTPDRQSFLKFKGQILSVHTMGDTLCVELSGYLKKQDAQNVGKYIFRLRQNEQIKIIQVMNKDSSMKEFTADPHGYPIDVQYTKKYYDDHQRGIE